MATGTMNLAYLQRKITATFIRWIVSFVVMVAPKRRILVSQARSLTPTWTATIQSSVSSRHIRVHVYQPLSAVESTTGSSSRRLPVHINFHGGAFVLPKHGEDAEHCVYMADTAGCVVIDADYAKAPEYPFPAPLEDAIDVYTWVRSNPKGLWDTEKVTVGGYSAGGNLALSLIAETILARGRGRSDIKGAVVWYPPIDYSRRTLPTEQLCYKPLEPGYPGIAVETDFFTKCYVPPNVDPKNPRLSPIYADLGGFPPMLLICGECDNLCREGEDFVSAVNNAGGRAEFMRIDDAGHAWDKLYKTGEAKYEASKNLAFAKVIEILKSVQQV